MNSKPLFEIVTPQNSMTIILTNNHTGHTETWNVAKGRPWAIFAFAKQQGIHPNDVGYFIDYGEART